MKQNKVSSNFAQDYSNPEKAQARANIDAASTAIVTGSNPGLMSVADKVKLDSIESGAQANVQANWAQTDVDAPSYIQNKPENLVQDANYVHTDNNFTTAEKTKLAGIEDGAEVNVQADWTQSDTTADSYIQHKPGIPAQLTVMRKATDTANVYRYVKVAELVPNARQYYTDAYNFSFICNGPVGTDGYSNEHGIFSLSLQCRYDTNVYYVTAGWAEYGHYTLNSDDAYRNISSALVMRQFEDIGGGTRVCRKVEVWLKLWTGFSDHDAVSISYLQNTGVHQYRTTYPSKTEDRYPWTVTKGTIWATTTAPTMDSTSPYSYTSQEFEAKDTSVQSDWTEANSGSLAYIQNKPIVPSITRYESGGSGGAVYSNIDFRLGSNNQILGKSSNNNDYVLHGFDAPVTSSQLDTGKFLMVSVDGAGNQSVSWDTPAGATYSAGTGINISAGNEISWAYSVGRNLHRNTDGSIQTAIPGGTFEAPAEVGNSFVRLAGTDFSSAYMLACHHKTNDTYELALAYTASGMTGNYQWLGTETVVATDDSMTTKSYVVNGTAWYTPSARMTNSTIFDPTTHKAIIYDGILIIGPTTSTRIVIWNDSGTVKISFTGLEVGTIGAN